MPPIQRAIFQTSAQSSLVPSPGIFIQILTLALFAVLSVALSWPLASDLGNLLAGTNDPPLFTWILATVSKSIMTDPLAVFEGDIFYPYSSTITFSEPLIFPALISGVPAYALTGNPIFAYNITLLLFQTLSGWAACYAVYRISGSGAGAVLAGIVFAFSAFKLGYYNFINIHLSFAVPLAFVSAVAFFETTRWRYLFITVALMWIQAASIWYGAIPLGLVLGLLLVVFVLIRPGLWLVGMSARLLVAAALLALLVAPLALPYFDTHEQMQFVRELAEVNKFRADLLSFVDAGVFNRWGRWVDAGREPGLFVGFICIVLALCALLVSMVKVILRASGVARWALAIVLVAVCVCLVTLSVHAIATVNQFAAGAATDAVANERTSKVVLVAILLALPTLMILGLSWRRGRSTRSLRREEWVLIVGWFTFISMLLVLGPTIHVADRAIGHGLYALVYDYVPGFSGLRIAIRLAFLYLFFIGLLAAFALRMLAVKLPRRWTGLLWLVPALSLVELWPANVSYQRFDWDQPPAVYQQLAARADDAVVLELPTFDEHIDSTYMLWALKHDKPIVNGVSGFYPPHIQRLATLTRSLPNRPALEPLEQIHGLRYLVVHTDKIDDKALVQQWLSVADQPPQGIDFRGRYDDALLFELNRNPRPTWRWRRLIPAADAAANSRLRFEIDAGQQDNEANSASDLRAITRRVQLTVDKQPIDSFELKHGHNDIDTVMQNITSSVHPVALDLTQSYDITIDTDGDSRYAIGRTGVFSPVDIVVESAARRHGSLATIWINGVNHAPRQPGYNVVTLDPVSGKRLGRAAFDVSKDERQNQAMANYIKSAPHGSIVIVALKDRGIGKLDGVAQTSFALIGAAPLETTGLAPGASHLVIGVRGASAGTAVEIAGDRMVNSAVGVDRRGLGMTVKKFELQPAI